MGISLLDIVNNALATLGEQPLVNLENKNATPTSILVNRKIPIITRTILMEADWNCARVTTKLQQKAVSAKYGWAYAYALPTDPECLKVVQISLNQGESFIDLNDYYNRNAGPIESLFDIDENTLLCNSDSVYIKYTALIDYSKFDPFLADALSAQLAAELAYAITASTTNADYLMGVASKKLRKAKSRNALNRNIPRYEGDVISVRGYEWSNIRVDMSDEAETNG